MKAPYIKFHANTSSRSRVNICGMSDERTGMKTSTGVVRDLGESVYKWSIRFGLTDPSRRRHYET
jgi:hypothetical protein